MVNSIETTIRIDVEFHGRFQKFGKCFTDGKIMLDIPNLYFRLVPNDCGELYSIIDTNIEQGRNFIVSFIIWFDTDRKCTLDNFYNIIKVSDGCGISIVDINVSKC